MDSNKRKTNWYSNNYKKRKQFSFEPGMKGFLCTCNFREKDCIRDVYKLLNEYSDKLNGIEKCQNDNETNSQEDDDISTALSKEIDELQADAKKGSKKKFQVIETGVKNVLFIQTTVSDPLTLAMSIIKDVYETKQQRSRFLLRLVPVEIVTKAFMDDLRSKADAVLEKYFSQEPKTFSIVFNRHSNSNIQRSEVIEDLAAIITKKNPGNKADLKNPEIAVIVEAIRGFCLISVAPNYMSYKKYNLLEMCNPTQQKSNEKNSENSTEAIDVKNDTAIVDIESGVDAKNDAVDLKNDSEIDSKIDDAVDEKINDTKMDDKIEAKMGDAENAKVDIIPEKMDQ
ncbi:THUMP domain-containing protein 1 homolog [Leptopilina boulardi]|uniref:THUMP domain-containing protein 1 homolog n=1 Tax=Leptopilina boulardi TaxID=63433 RepID=UPI0021F5C73F|nr:THUMP domain-containing protein 1 homolog [Leptopilina boulardi]